MTFWVFGDSFMAYDENYITILKRSCNADNIHILAEGGSGLLFTYLKLMEFKDKIKKDDVVLIGLSSVDRHLFGEGDNWHIFAGGFSKTGIDVNTEFITGGLEAKQAVEGYFKYLYNPDHTSCLGHAVYTSILYSIVPSLSTQRVSVFLTLPSFNANTFNLPDKLFLDSNLHSIPFRYIEEKKGGSNEDIISTFISTRNHWIDGDENYLEYFFSKTTRMLKELQIDKLVID